MRPSALALLGTLAACSVPETALVLRVATDIPQGPGMTLTAVRVSQFSGSDATPHFTHVFALGDSPADPLLPDELRIEPRGGDASRRITIALDALGSDGATLFTQRASAGFTAGSVRLLDVFLAQRCLDASHAMCPDGSSCGLSGCEPVDRGSALPVYTPPDAGGPDAGACPSVPAVDFCNAPVPRLPADPVLDGVLDCGVAPHDVPLPTLASSAGVRAEYALAWRPTGLYVFAQVHEAAAVGVPNGTQPGFYYCADAVEIFIDPSERAASVAWNPHTIQLVVPAPSAGTTMSQRAGIVRTQPTMSGNDDMPWNQHAAAFPTADGYIVEAFVTAAELGSAWDPASATAVGFDLQFDVSGGEMRDECPTGTSLLGQFPLRAAAETVACPGQCVWPSFDGEAFCRTAFAHGS